MSTLPQTDSIEELARFWDDHDLTDFEEELEEIVETVFERIDGLAPKSLASVPRVAIEVT